MNYAIEEMKNVERLATQFLYVRVRVLVRVCLLLALASSVSLLLPPPAHYIECTCLAFRYSLSTMWSNKSEHGASYDSPV